MGETIPTCQIHKKIRGIIKCTNPSLADEDLCILHSQNQAKDQEAFKGALFSVWDNEGSKSYNFRGVFFPRWFDPTDLFGSKEFSKPVHFREAIFMKTAHFSDAIFADKADFSKAKFKEGAIFSGAKFKEVSFSGATFTERAGFDYANFSQEANFDKATIKEASFLADFEQKASFFGTTFEEKASFPGGTFTKFADFRKATFIKGAVFYIRFKERANFSEATFEDSTYFANDSFTSEADFSGTTIGGRLLFRKIKRSLEDALLPAPFHGNFMNLEFEEKGQLRFQDMSLAHVQFAGTDLRRPEFHHVGWNHLWGGRRALYDEVLLRQKELSLARKILISTRLARPPGYPPPAKDEYAEVERLYRNLQVNYESVNDYKSSGDFHYGELEMHRRASKWRWFPLYWYNIYRLSSGYGERPLRAVLTLAALLLVFSLVLLRLENIPDVPDKWSLAGFWQAVLYVFQQGTLQKPDWLELDSTGGKFLSALMPVLIPGQTALFLLALRNRLGRRR